LNKNPKKEMPVAIIPPADKGLDDGKLIKELWDAYNIKPVIDIRNL
jgi:hypothetical protein